MTNPDPSVDAMLERYRAAVYRKDVDAFVTLYDERVAIFDLWGAWRCDGRDAWREVVAAWFGSLGNTRVAVRFDDVRATIDRHLAVVHAFVAFENVGPDGVARRAMDNRLTWGLSRVAGQDWTIVHEHTSAPVDVESMKALLHRQRAQHEGLR